jgi:hypothetical protein
MKTKRAVAAKLEPAMDVVAPITTDHAARRLPPSTRALRRGCMSDMQTAAQFERNCSVEEIAVRPKGLLWPISSKYYVW